MGRRYKTIGLTLIVLIVSGLAIGGLRYFENDTSSQYGTTGQPLTDNAPNFESNGATRAVQSEIQPVPEPTPETTGLETLPNEASATAQGHKQPAHSNAGGNSHASAHRNQSGHTFCVMGLCF